MSWNGLVLLQAHGNLKGRVAIVGSLDVLAGIHSRGNLVHFVLDLRHIFESVEHSLCIELAIGEMTLLLHQALGVALEVLLGTALHPAGHELLEISLGHLVGLHALLHYLAKVRITLRKANSWFKNKCTQCVHISPVPWTKKLPEQYRIG